MTGKISVSGDARVLVREFSAQHIEHVESVLHRLLASSAETMQLSRNYSDSGFKALGDRVAKASRTYEIAAQLLQLLSCGVGEEEG